MRLEEERGLNSFMRKQQKQLKSARKRHLANEIARQTLLYNKVIKHVPIYGKKYKDSIEHRARMNVEARYFT